MPRKKKEEIKDAMLDIEDKVEEPVLTKAEEMANQIVEAAKQTSNEITYGEINSMLAENNPDKDLLEEIYDLVESKNVSILETREPQEHELENDVEDEDVEPDDSDFADAADDFDDED